jgi:hypothetical protein
VAGGLASKGVARPPELPKPIASFTI